MTRTISFALGNLWTWSKEKNRNDLINYVKKLDISGVELTLSSKEEVYALNLSKNNKKWLRQLDYITIHAPFRLIRKSEDEKEVIKQLDIISKIYKDVNAKNVIIHPTEIPPRELLERYNFKVSTENMPPKHKIKIPELEKIFDKYPDIGLCLDVAHAYLWSKHETSKIVEIFEDKISQIHLSGTYRNKDHQSLQYVVKDFLFSIEPIKKLNVPIVIEEDIKIKSLKYVKEEVEYIKELLSDYE